MDIEIITCVHIVVVFLFCIGYVVPFISVKYVGSYFCLILILSGDIETNPGPRPSRRRQCRILYANVRGLHANLKDLSVASKQFDILFCSETLVSDMRHVSEILIPGFKKPILLKRNSIPRAQGMAAYIGKDFSASRKSNFECGCHEVQVLKVCGRTNNFYLFSVYRNPDMDDAIFDCLLTSMATIQEQDRKAAFLFIGDFNAHHREWLNSISPTDIHGIRALDFTSETGCDQLVEGSTHRSGNCLDLLFSDTPGVVSCRVGGPIGTSDHSYISAVIKTEQTVPDVSFSRKIHLKSRADWEGILRELSMLDWPHIYRQPDSIGYLNNICNDIIDRLIPFRIILFRNKDKAWFNDTCRQAHQEKQEAYHLWQRNPSHLTWSNYTRLRAAASAAYAAAEREYNEGIKNDLMGIIQSNKWWSTFKSALFGIDATVPPLVKPDGSITHDPKEKASLFADVFEGKQCNAVLEMPQSCFPDLKLGKLAFRSKEIESILLDLDAYGGAGPDGVFPLFFKKASKVLSPKLGAIFRKDSRAGAFNSGWRVGNITPLSKSGCSSSSPSDYRPITITPVLSKVYERLLARRLRAFAERNNLFPNLQFGFRKGLGTCDALLTISHTVQKALDSGSEVRMVGLDFSAAFDRVNHAALIFKLKQFGVGGSFLNILIEFLTNRRQRVVVDGQFSDWRNVISGVPQGSVLGPLLFILYTHDMWFGLENKLVAYADDATLLAVIPSPDMRLSVSESINRDLAKINEWCKQWGMKMNPKKTQSMILSRSRTIHPQHPDLYIDNEPLTTNNSFKILGVTFDRKLTFEAHLRSMSKLISQKLGLLRKSVKIFGDQSVLLKCFNSFILPSFEYCSPVWSSAAESHLKLLDKNLNGCKFLIPDLDTNLGHRRSVSSLCMLFKIYSNPEHPLHSELPNLFVPLRLTRAAAGSHNHSFVRVRCNTVQFSRSFIPASTKSWNDLPGDVVECLDLQRFKVKMNKFLLHRDI